MYPSIPDHDIAALEIPEHKIFVVHMGEVGAQSLEIIDQFFLILRNLQSVEEIVFKIQQVAEDLLFAKFAGRDGPAIVQSFVSPDLQTGQLFQALTEQLIDRFMMALSFQLVQQGDISKIFLEINSIILIYRIDLGDRAATFAEVPAEMDECPVLPHVVIVCGYIGAIAGRQTEIDT